MKQVDSNPALAPLVRWFMIVVALFVLAGGSLWVLPNGIGSIWPWELAPFNARFLGGIYLAELTIVAMLVPANRWAPGRIILPMALSFTLVVSIISLVYLERFNWQRRTTWIWFFIYLFSAAAAAAFLWRYRRLPPAEQQAMPGHWRGYLLGQGLVLGLYGIGMLLAPTVFTGFWPWRIDDFHGRIYSAIFLTGATGALLIMKSAAPSELRGLGWAQIALGTFAITGMLVVDTAVHRVNWTLPGVWLWIAGFAALIAAGIAMLWRERAVLAGRHHA